MKDIYVTVRFHLCASGLEQLPDFSANLESALGEYDDGRRRFSVELILDGIEKLVEGQIRRSVSDEMRALYGKETVPSDSGGSTSRAVLETERECLALRLRANYEPSLLGVFIDDSGETKVLCQSDVSPDGTLGILRHGPLTPKGG